MPVIGLSGPNGIGKTTAVKRWCDRYPRLVAALADNQRECRAADWDAVMCSPPNIREWKHKTEEKQLRVDYHREAGHLAIIDSARTTALNFFLPHEPIILLVCSWQKLEEFLRARCKRSGKEFRADYWDRRKLEYECSRRYQGFASKGVGRVKVFRIEDQARDWPAVDEYFGRLYREINNRLVRERVTYP